MVFTDLAQTMKIIRETLGYVVGVVKRRWGKHARIYSNVVFCRLSCVIYRPRLHVRVLLDFPVSKDGFASLCWVLSYQVQSSSLVSSAKCLLKSNLRKFPHQNIPAIQ